MPAPVALQVTCETTLVSFSPSTWIGRASLRVVVVAVHPGMGVAATSAIGLFLGSSTFTAPVLALSDAVGALKGIAASWPPGTLPGVISTWAYAAPVRDAVVTSPAPTTSAARRAVRRTGRVEEVVDMVFLDS